MEVVSKDDVADGPCRSWRANKSLMRTGDLLLAALTLILALEGKVWTIAMLERQLDGCARDQLDSAVAQSAVSA